jgi:serine/threonine protein kinase
MKQVCLVCSRAAPDRNLYCQDVRCAAEMSPFVLDYGEYLGDIEIVKVIALLPSATVYEARRSGKQIFLKIAHPGHEHTARLEREALLLSQLHAQRATGEHLPQLLPATAQASVATAPYGKIVLGQHLLYYIVFAYIPGESLRAVLKRTPQLWVEHVGRTVLAMAVALTTLQSKGYLHLGVCPDTVLVSFDPPTQKPQVLLLDLGLACERKQFASCWYPYFVTPAYIAPELGLANGQQQPDYHTDVYGLGLTLYEMLVGKPALADSQQNATALHEAVQAGRMVRMSRTDDVEPIAKLALQAVSRERLPTAQTFAQELLVYFKRAPTGQRRSWWNIETALVAAVILLALAFAIALVTTFTNQADLAALLWSLMYA